MNKIKINNNGSIAGLSDQILKLQKENRPIYNRSTLNQTLCSGTNAEDCTNSTDCTDTTNQNYCTNKGTCVSSTIGFGN